MQTEGQCCLLRQETVQLCYEESPASKVSFWRIRVAVRLNL